MDELTLRIDYLSGINTELEQYLLNLNGISKVNQSDEIINIKYDSELINIEMIKLEIFLFLELDKTPSLISFDKHAKNKTTKKSILINDICCEYCFKSSVQELLLRKGIEKVDSDFEYDYSKKIVLNIEYDDTLISQNEIENLELKLNSLN